MKKRNSFTLIELLVVIAVLAGLMALLVPNFMQVRIKSRDMRRKNDLKGIQKALELYKLGQSIPIYPVSFTVCTPLVDGNSVVYMQKIPQDPSSQCNASPVSYYYLRDVSDSGKYTLCACLENINDPEGISCAGAPACSGTYYKLTEP
ncbi:hypothetical protein COV87_00645 [Candidatus Roizmanbacteria bacterium CG11_big_fil_rev_8_21_14_0_20_37_16]|uniref:Type II secretion system protein GspG C-terminal domain-containing protein n=1 Tax=Candidatus Roizmanbacteria bacterium CG11_big_fil_rev_8_21_14_0_20_37_16 TaxID=1974857 RepID=A0A2H0KKY3_9BACT|nr:MAG: hypothetical protein COV87_00645 [Candidatus Roizmanbacteria bacterium CG11_big_fil_rev_8_21_14_0_20_37_16]